MWSALRKFSNHCGSYVYVCASIYFHQDAILQGLVNRFKEFRRDKSKPKSSSKRVTSHSTKGKSPGITRPVIVPQLQVHVCVYIVFPLI